MKPYQLRDRKTGRLRHGGRWMIKFRAPDGTWRQQIGGATEKEAARALRGIETDIDRGTWIDPRSEHAEGRTRGDGCRTFGDMVKRFGVFYSDRAEATQQNLEVCVNWLTGGIRGGPPLLPADTPLAGLTPARLRRVYDGIAASSLAVGSKNLLLTVLRMILRWAWKHPSIALGSNPAADLPRFRAPGTRGGDGDCNPVSKAEVWTRTEALAMIAAAEATVPEKAAVMLRTALETGMRHGELCGLLWSGVDFDRRLILVSRNYDRRGTKSGRDRVVPMTAGLAARLRRWKAASACSKEHDAVFPDEHGRVRPKYYGWSGFVRSIAEAAGAVRPGMRRFGHMTRHYYATQWLLSGGSAEQLAETLGHADTGLICRVYSHFQDADFVATVDRIGLSLEPPAGAAPAVLIQG